MSRRRPCASSWWRTRSCSGRTSSACSRPTATSRSSARPATAPKRSSSVTTNCGPTSSSVDLHIPGGGGQSADRADHGPLPDTDPGALGDGARTIDRHRRSRRWSPAPSSRCPGRPSWTAADEAQLRRTVRKIKQVRGDPPPAGRLRPVAPQPAPASGGTQRRRDRRLDRRPAALATSSPTWPACRRRCSSSSTCTPTSWTGFATWMTGCRRCRSWSPGTSQTARVGHVYIAPGDMHLRLGAGSRHRAVVDPGVDPPSLGRRAVPLGRRACGARRHRRGADRDGRRRRARPARDRQRGGHTFAQDEASCAVFGMPRAAGEIGAVQQFLDPSGSPGRSADWFREPRA